MDGQSNLVFQPSGDACGACMALAGMPYTGSVHENCMCQAVPDEEGDCEVDYSFTTTRWGNGEYDGAAGGEITVTCPDGTVISESFEFDFSPYAGGDGSDLMDLAVDGFEAEAAALCAECQEQEPFLCC